MCESHAHLGGHSVDLRRREEPAIAQPAAPGVLRLVPNDEKATPQAFAEARRDGLRDLLKQLGESQKTLPEGTTGPARREQRQWEARALRKIADEVGVQLPARDRDVLRQGAHSIQRIREAIMEKLLGMDLPDFLREK
jgi:hypothetical protein